jgi:hypothetical protein
MAGVLGLSLPDRCHLKRPIQSLNRIPPLDRTPITIRIRPDGAKCRSLQLTEVLDGYDLTTREISAHLGDVYGAEVQGHRHKDHRPRHRRDADLVGPAIGAGLCGDLHR